MTNKLIYITGPYTQGDTTENIRNAIAVADIVLRTGNIPYIPHLSHLWQMISPHSWEKWVEIGCFMVARCDAFIRITGISTGANREEMVAVEKNLPIARISPPFMITDIKELMEWLSAT